MRDEILKHTQKIHKSISNRHNSLKGKIKEIFVEILIIIFAVTLSIYFHDLSEEHHKRLEATFFLKNIKNALTEDTKGLVFFNGLDSIQKLDFNFILNLSQKDYNYLKKTNSKYLSFRPNLNLLKINRGYYEGFKSSNKLDYLENDSLKVAIINFYEMTVPDLFIRDKKRYDTNLEIIEGNIKKEYTLEERKKMYHIFNLYNNFSMSENKDAILEAKKIIHKIEKELKKD